MMKLTVLYGAPAGQAAFDAHYEGVHGPLTRKIRALQRFEHGKPTTLDGSPSPYDLMADLWFHDAAAFAAAMASPEGDQTAADVRNFATGGATMLLTRPNSPESAPCSCRLGPPPERRADGQRRPHVGRARRVGRELGAVGCGLWAVS